MSERLWKRITLRTGSTGTPSQKFIESEKTIGQLLEDLGVNPEKSDVEVNDEVVGMDFVPAAESRIAILPKKYSSGAAA